MQLAESESRFCLASAKEPLATPKQLQVPRPSVFCSGARVLCFKRSENAEISEDSLRLILGDGISRENYVRLVGRLKAADRLSMNNELE